MRGVQRLAAALKDRTNPSPYTPMIGKIIKLPELQIQMGSRIMLDKDDICTTFDLYETKEHEGRIEYVNLNKTAVLLPCSGDNKFIVIGVLQE